ncbi:TPA: hypothetical protein HA246_07475 [Candidatus Woesearchaeota archaeon]|nr:hypothetical protein [Candidatus Woesearchaeota archaeon]
MEITLENIIGNLEINHGIKLDSITARASKKFLKRQDRDYARYKFLGDNRHIGSGTYQLFQALTDRLMLFLYLTGKIPIITGTNGDIKTQRIKSIDDLWMLKPKELGVLAETGHPNPKAFRTDDRLTKLCYRIYDRSRYKFPNWTGHLDELGKDEAVAKYFGREISSKDVQNAAHYTNEDVITAARDRYDLDVTTENKPVYLQFLKRQIKKLGYNINQRTTNNPKNPYPYFNAMVDRLLLFAYLIGKLKFIGEDGKKTQVSSIDSIRVLYARRTKDYEINCLRTRMDARAKRYHLPKFNSQFDDVASDGYVVAKYGRAVTIK